MKYHLLSILSASLICKGFGFFDLFRSSPTGVTQTAEDLSDPHPIRGVPDYLISTFQIEHFVCDSGKTILPFSSINDGYCDCKDHTDEPGTSACEKGVFYCRNKGYKVVKIPSSRVDDTVCDCCDGSDEKISNIQCPNTCRAAADKERSQLQKLQQAYQLGSIQRKQIVQSTVDKLKNEAAQLPHLNDEFNRVSKVIETLQKQITARTDELNSKQIHDDESLTLALDTLLQLNTQNLEQLTKYVYALVQILDLSEEQIHELITFPISSSEDQTDQVHSCEITRYSNDSPLLQAFCTLNDSSRKLQEIQALLRKLVKTYRSYTEIMILLGYYQLYSYSWQELDKIIDKVREDIVAMDLSHQEDASKTTQQLCPKSFETLSVRDHCELADRLKIIVDQLLHRDNVLDEDSKLQELKQTKKFNEEFLQELTEKKTDAEKASKLLVNPTLESLFESSRNQCFDIKDGKFSYAVCLLQKVTQKEEGGSSSAVTLGEFEEIVHNKQQEDGSLIMKFNHGQYCYAIQGSRQAEVRITCGEKNQVLTAGEPSTCAYGFTMESPLACTEQFAMANGLAV
jgi:protein kinase C substrate 80K-H